MSIDKAALVAALKNATNNPKAVEVVIQRLESGEFEQGIAAPKKGRRPEPERAVLPETAVEERGEE